MKSKLKSLMKLSCFMLAMALIVGPAFMDNADAGKRGNRDGYGKNKSADIGWSMHEGMDADGNDTLRMQFHAPKKNRRAKNYLARHFTPEEMLYGPGDQSTAWQQNYDKRDNDRSMPRDVLSDPGYSGPMRRGAMRRYYEKQESYGYGYGSDSCDLSYDPLY